MATQSMTLEQVRLLGISALSQQLGMVGMIRFLQQSETGWGDYTKERGQWLAEPDLQELYNTIKNSEQKS